jgi:hypothetical protein
MELLTKFIHWVLSPWKNTDANDPWSVVNMPGIYEKWYVEQYNRGFRPVKEDVFTPKENESGFLQ